MPVYSEEPEDDRVRGRIDKAISTKESAKTARRAKRITSRKLATLLQDGMSAGLSCTMIDRSSTGAKLEIVTDRFNNRLNEINVGDRFTLVLTAAQERTLMPCEIMWVSGKRCGVNFCGQIRTEVIKPAKRAMPASQSKKPKAGKKFKSLFS